MVSLNTFGRILGFLDFSQHSLSKNTIVALELCAEIIVLSSSESNLQSDKNTDLILLRLDSNAEISPRAVAFLVQSMELILLVLPGILIRKQHNLTCKSGDRMT